MAVTIINPGDVVTVSKYVNNVDVEVAALDCRTCDVLTIAAAVVGNDMLGMKLVRAIGIGGTNGIGDLGTLADDQLDDVSDLILESNFSGDHLAHTAGGGKFSIKLAVDGTGFLRILATGNSAESFFTLNLVIGGAGTTRPSGAKAMISL